MRRTRTVTPDNNLYGVLGVSPSAPQEQIRSQYRVLVRKYHPDLHPGDASAALMMERVNAAYDVLGSSEERRQYDAEISASSQSWGETAASSSYGQSAYGSPAAGAGPQSTWNPQWGNAAGTRVSGRPKPRQCGKRCALRSAPEAVCSATCGPTSRISVRRKTLMAGPWPG